MIRRVSIKERFQRIFFFFPFQLLLLHLKKNHLLMLFWLILFGYVTSSIATKYGVPILFLYPEYMGTTDIWAYGVTGFSCGGFIMAFNLYSYVMHGFRFPFIASLSRPFLKFSFNNFIIPLLFVGIYIYQSAKFQANQEFVATSDIVYNLIAFCGGIGLFILLSFIYFLRTNKDILRLFKGKKEVEASKPSWKKGYKRWMSIKNNRRTWRVETYLAHPLKVQLARDSQHYDAEVIEKILSQNHINASIFEVIVIASFLSIGLFREYDLFMIPAAASIFLLFTMALMAISALFSWFKGWTLSIIVIVLLGLNFSSTREHKILHSESKAFGIDYNQERISYKDYIENGLPNPLEAEKDREQVIKILEQRVAATGEEKPKLVFVCSSGGGLRSSLWSYRCLTYLDSVSKGKVFNHTQLFTGSSGGMIGVALFRELKLQDQANNSLKSDYNAYLDNIGKDILNPVAFSLVTHDLFIRYQTFEDRSNTFIKDRGYSFEKQLNENTNYLLDKRLIDYALHESNATIPMMVLSPTVLNDGRKMLISSTPVSFLSYKQKANYMPLVENIDFQHFMKSFDAPHLKVTNAIRMSATFPYILPTVSLPSEPTIDLMDAGLRDNYGVTTAYEFIHQFEDWLDKNTSGIIIVQLRDLEKKASFIDRVNSSFVKKLVSPLETVYGNIFNTHNYAQDQLSELLPSNLDIPVDHIILELKQVQKTKISLSWHLSQYEKSIIINGINQPHNQKQISKLLHALN